MPAHNMPIIPQNKLSPDAVRWASLICIGERLRASKPPVPTHKVPSEKYGHTYEPINPDQGRAAYIWRMVAFQISPNPKHQCVPVCADFDLPGDFDSRRQESRYCDCIVNEIVNAVPKNQWHGVIRWGQAFGQIGTPRYNEEGAVIYR